MPSANGAPKKSGKMVRIEIFMVPNDRGPPPGSAGWCEMRPAAARSHRLLEPGRELHRDGAACQIDLAQHVGRGRNQELALPAHHEYRMRAGRDDVLELPQHAAVLLANLEPDQLIVIRHA